MGRVRGHLTAVAVAAGLALTTAACTSDTPTSAGTAGGGAEADVQAAPAVDLPSGRAPGITVAGSGRVSGRPDTLTATVGVEVQRPTVQEALDAGNAGAQRVIDAVREAGVAEEDVRTAQFEVYPQYDQRPDETSPTIRGYLVSNLLEVRIRDLEGAGDVLAAATEAGGDDARVQGVQFSLEDNQALVDQARERAFEDARARAEAYAGLAGRELGGLVSVEETATPATPTRQFAQEADAAGGAVPIEPGQQEVVVRVTTVWSFA